MANLGGWRPVMRDTIVTATAGDEGFALTVAITTDLVRETQRRHTLSPTATAAAGRLITGAALLGAGLKDSLRISLQVAGDGPLQPASLPKHGSRAASASARARTSKPRARICR